MILIDFLAVKSRVFYLKSFWPIKWVKRKSFFTVKWHLLPITPLHTTSYTTKTHPDLPNTTLLSPILTWYICNIALAGISKKLAPPLPTRAPISTTTFCAVTLHKLSASLWNWRQGCKEWWQFTVNKFHSTISWWWKGWHWTMSFSSNETFVVCSFYVEFCSITRWTKGLCLVNMAYIPFSIFYGLLLQCWKLA